MYTSICSFIYIYMYLYVYIHIYMYICIYMSYLSLALRATRNHSLTSYPVLCAFCSVLLPVPVPSSLFYLFSTQILLKIHFALNYLFETIINY